MGWSISVLRIRETTVRIHLTFFLLLAWVGAAQYAQGGAAAAFDGVLFIALVFLCVVLHEFGHILMARRYGIRTPDVTLLPIGGLARLERMPERPGREIAVALAGPAVNVVIAAVLLAFVDVAPAPEDIAEIDAAAMPLVARLAAVNVILVLFNMIPAFPTDGGRVFRALLAYRFDRVRATRYAAIAGQIFASLFVVLGLMGNPVLALIGVFIFLAGGAESRDVEERAAARDRRASEAMILRYESLGPQSTAADAARLLLLTTQQEFPVLDGEHRLRGFVTRAGLIEAMGQGGEHWPVTRFMQAEAPAVGPEDGLQSVMDAMGPGGQGPVAVTDRDGRFLGYVTRENLAELFMLASARRDAAG